MQKLTENKISLGNYPMVISKWGNCQDLIKIRFVFLIFLSLLIVLACISGFGCYAQNISSSQVPASSFETSTNNESINNTGTNNTRTGQNAVETSTEEFKPVFNKIITNGLRYLPKIALTFDADMAPSMVE